MAVLLSSYAVVNGTLRYFYLWGSFLQVWSCGAIRPWSILDIAGCNSGKFSDGFFTREGSVWFMKEEVPKGQRDSLGRMISGPLSVLD